MGLLGILKTIGGFAGAPFTGGATLPIAMSGISDILGGVAKNRAAAQTTNENQEIARSNADINRRAFMLEAPGARAHSAARASMIANFQPAHTTWGGPGSGLRGELPVTTGGFNNPDMYSPDARKVANNAIQAHLLAQLTGADNVPEIPKPAKSGVLDKILGVAGMGTGILGMLGGIGGGSSPIYSEGGDNIFS